MKSVDVDGDDGPSPPSPTQQHELLPTLEEQQQQLAELEGYDVDLVNKSDAFDCGICLLLPRHPVQVSCCGKKFCRECINHALLTKNSCPHCQANGSTFQLFEDKAQQHATLELKVYCPNKKQGCGWTGELCHQSTHLNLDPAEGSENKGCQYVELVCIHCSKLHPRYHMLSCPLQQYTCPYCKHYTASYSDVTSHHMLECEEFPVPCPFCRSKVTQKDIHLHKTDCIVQQKPMQSSAVLLPATVVHVFVPPPSFVMTNFTQNKTTAVHWFSPPFYSHIGGYKMCLRVVANGARVGAGTHVTVFVWLMRGEYDDNLFWPFRGDITFQLVNHRADEGHVEHTVYFDDRAPDSAAGRVTDGEQARMGSGLHKFISHSALCYDEIWNTEYLKNDSLEFQITRVKTAEKLSVSASDLQPGSGMARLDQPQVLPVPPVIIIMSGFISWKMRDLDWFSPPFYSHIGGYKMCLSVTANGLESGHGTHVSVGVHLMRGKYDENLLWPFRGDITLQLVNQRADEGHVEDIIPFDDSVSDDIAGRVTDGIQVASGRGFIQFICHSALNYDKYENTEYLKNDSLEFRVTRVTVLSLPAPVTTPNP